MSEGHLCVPVLIPAIVILSLMDGRIQDDYSDGSACQLCYLRKVDVSGTWGL